MDGKLKGEIGGVVKKSWWDFIFNFTFTDFIHFFNFIISNTEGQAV